MLTQFFIDPSFITLFISALIILTIFTHIILNFKEITKLNTFEKLSILSIVSIVISTHKLVHLSMSKTTVFN